MDLADAIDLFRAGPEVDDGIIDASLDDVFGDSASGLSRSRVTTATVVQHEGPRRMTDLFREIMGEAAAWVSCLYNAVYTVAHPPFSFSTCAYQREIENYY